MGDCNGSYLNKTYFKCSSNTGMFIKPRQIKKIYSPEDLLEMIIRLKDRLLPFIDPRSPYKSPAQPSRPSRNSQSPQSPTSPKQSSHSNPPRSRRVHTRSLTFKS